MPNEHKLPIKDFIAQYDHEEANQVTIAWLRHAFSKEAQVLDSELVELGISALERLQIYDRIGESLKQIEEQVQALGSYERLRAAARVLGLFRPLMPLNTKDTHHG